jgi:predicted DNA-binding mobile mystery protein A
MDIRKQLGRKALDRQMAAFRPLAARTAPASGWIRATRDALGMSGADLANRLDVTQPNIVKLEKSEAAGTIQLDTLRRAAAAMDCALVYGLVPNGSLDAIVRRRARSVAERALAASDHSMRLEGQTPPDELHEDLLAGIAEQLIDTRRLWAEPDR